MTIFSPGLLGAGQGNDQYTKILLHLDGNLTDSNLGGSAHTWTAHSSSFVTSGQRYGSGALQCPYIDTPSHSDFNRGSSDWTIDLVFDTLAAGNGTARYLCGQNNSAFTLTNTSFLIQLSTANKITATASNGSAFTAITSSSTFTTAGLHWLQFRRTGNTIELRVDTTLEATSAFTGTVPSATSNYSIGRAGEFTLDPFSGLIDEYRDCIGIARDTAVPTAAYGP